MRLYIDKRLVVDFYLYPKSCKWQDALLTHMIQEEAVHIFFVGTLTTSGVTSDWRIDPNNIFKSWIIIRWNIVAVLNNIRLTGTESRDNICDYYNGSK